MFVSVLLQVGHPRCDFAKPEQTCCHLSQCFKGAARYKVKVVAVLAARHCSLRKNCKFVSRRTELSKKNTSQVSVRYEYQTGYVKMDPAAYMQSAYTSRSNYENHLWKSIVQ